jgi:hypothetical protein
VEPAFLWQCPALCAVLASMVCILCCLPRPAELPSVTLSPQCAYVPCGAMSTRKLRTVVEGIWTTVCTVVPLPWCFALKLPRLLVACKMSSA